MLYQPVKWSPDSAWVILRGCSLGERGCGTGAALGPSSQRQNLGVCPGAGERGGAEERLHVASRPRSHSPAPRGEGESEDFRQLCREMYPIVPAVGLWEGGRWNPQGKNNMWIKPCCYYSFSSTVGSKISSVTLSDSPRPQSQWRLWGCGGVQSQPAAGPGVGTPTGQGRCPCVCKWSVTGTSLKYLLPGPLQKMISGSCTRL